MKGCVKMRHSNAIVIGAGCLLGAAAAGAFAAYGAHCNAKASRGFDERDFLHTSGRHILNAAGERVSLRGVNLGGWLIQESWMTPVSGEDKKWGNHDTLCVLEKRFGAYGAQQLFKTYQDNWITDYDLDYLAALGVNCIRLPFWYRNLYGNDSCRGQADFELLDRIVDACSKRRIYVVLDLHGAPGFQSDDHCCGKVNSSVLFDSSAAGARARDMTMRVWSAVAEHFCGNPAVAAYDLLNEPMNGFHGKRKDDAALWRLYNRLYEAVRLADEGHIITLEGVWDLGNLPDPKKYGWHNVMYQLHNYNWSRLEIKAKLLDAKRHSHWNVPLLVGEFQASGIWDYVLDEYNKAGFSWLTWTYKGARHGKSDWFMFSGEPQVADVHNDSYEELLLKWGEAVRTKKSFTENTELTKVLSKHYARQAYEQPPQERQEQAAGSRPRIRLKFGLHLVKGVNRTQSGC